MQNLNQLLKILIQADIDFVLIGGYAGVVHGVTGLTRDLDILSSVINVGDYQTLKKDAVQVKVFGEACKVISLFRKKQFNLIF